MSDGKEHHLADNGAGWRLALRRTLPQGARRGRPVLIIPGYQMNSSIFGYHPTGASIEDHLAARGLEVWSVDLRGQGASVRTWGGTKFGLPELAVEDVGTAIAYARAVAKSDTVDVIGCSLGTALTFAHVACVPDGRVAGVVAMGGVVTWGHVNRALRLVAHAPWAIAQLRMTGTRRLARAALPVVTRVAPKLLSLYLNVETTDTSPVDDLVATVEDPNPVINRQIARWLVKRELVIRRSREGVADVNVSRALAAMTMQFLCVSGRQDGVVPPQTSRLIYETIGSADRTLLEVGDATTPMAHADLFLARRAQELVFEPVAEWLLARAG